MSYRLEIYYGVSANAVMTGGEPYYVQGSNFYGAVPTEAWELTAKTRMALRRKLAKVITAQPFTLKRGVV